MASSPTFKAQFPTEASAYAAAANKGWQFLQNAWARYGREGAYQTIYNYGVNFHDQDEIAATLGLGRNHVATLIFRGKQQLREKLGQQQSDGFRRNERGLSD